MSYFCRNIKARKSYVVLKNLSINSFVILIHLYYASHSAAIKLESCLKKYYIINALLKIRLNLNDFICLCKYYHQMATEISLLPKKRKIIVAFAYLCLIHTRLFTRPKQ